MEHLCTHLFRKFLSMRFKTYDLSPKLELEIKGAFLKSRFYQWSWYPIDYDGENCPKIKIQTLTKLSSFIIELKNSHHLGRDFIIIKLPRKSVGDFQEGLLLPDSCIHRRLRPHYETAPSALRIINIARNSFLIDYVDCYSRRYRLNLEKTQQKKPATKSQPLQILEYFEQIHLGYWIINQRNKISIEIDWRHFTV